MYGSLDTSTSALVAQRTRLNVIAANMANASTILNENGEYAPYRRKFAVLAEGDPATGSRTGVHVGRIETDANPFQMKYQPDSPYADERGMVAHPNVSPVIEQTNAMEAARAYEANIAAIEATKSMISVALQMIA